MPRPARRQRQERRAHRLVVIPGARFKNGREHLIPLGGLALEILASTHRVPGSPFTFAHVGSRPSGVSKVRPAIDEIIDQEWTKDRSWRLHDLRRTTRTRLASLGIRDEVGEAILGHATKGIIGTYNVHRYLDERRVALELWEKELKRIVSG